MKRLLFKTLSLISIISLFLVWTLPVMAMDVPNPNSNFYVLDQANLISTSTELDIIQTSEALYNETGAQIVVVTLENLGGYDLEQSSVKLFREWGIGDKEKNNGVLIILALEEREVRIEVGYGLEGAIPDSVAGRMLDDYMLPNLQEGDYDSAFFDTYQAVLKRVMNEYGIDSLAGVETQSEQEEVPWFWIIVGAIILLSLDGYYLNGFVLNLLLRTILLATFNGSSGGGSFNRGGGGRSGGGGASRGW